ncbi:MAG: hypothetical protein LBG43_00885, partial [Treponema sp.]|nr:hypothetical protein [Treponema sp.]
MHAIEAIILYMVIFFPSVFSGVEEGSAIAFSINQALSRVFIYNAPPMALIWFLALRKTSATPAPNTRLFLPALQKPTESNSASLNPRGSFILNGRRLLATFTLALSGLLLISVSASIASGLAERITGRSFEAGFGVQTPDTAAG